MDFDHLNFVLQQINTDYDASEAQAIACGMLCVNMAVDRAIWLKLLSDVDNSHGNFTQPETGLLSRLFDQVRYQLQDAALDFQLLLPDDQLPLAERVGMLQDWCRGFLLGVSLAGIDDFASLPEDTRDLLADFADIGTAGELELDEEESISEQSYLEIAEYIRMGVLLINEELQPLSSSPTSPFLH